jgi:hypothetical protein
MVRTGVVLLAQEEEVFPVGSNPVFISSFTFLAVQVARFTFVF